MCAFSKIRKRALLRLGLLFVFFAVLFLLCWHLGMQQLSGWQGPGGSLSNELYLPAIMMNAGYGFTVTDTHAIPELRAFLDYQTTSFDVVSLPADIQILPPEPVNCYHKNLIWLAALTWRVFGISWEAIKIPLILLLFVSAVLVFCISRLALPTVWAYLITLGFVSNQTVLSALFVLRDFSKAPFILFVVLLLGHAIKKRLSTKHYLLIALCIGCCLGIGMGFRRDMQALAPLSALLLLTCRLRPMSPYIVVKVLAVLLIIGAFLITGWPAISAFYPERYLNSHDLIMGFSSNADAETGLIRPASYEKHLLLDDYYVTMQAGSSAYLGYSMPKKSYMECQEQLSGLEQENFVKKSYVEYIAKTFPADMLTRSYAAVLRTVTGVRRNKVGIFRGVEKFSFIFLLISFLIIAAVSPYKAWQLVLFLCFFCGYTSLQFSQRHAFHMVFTAYFFSAFALHYLLSGLYRLLRLRSFTKVWAVVWEYRRQCLLASGWLAVTVLIFWMPLKIARAIQERNVYALCDNYQQAPRQPLDYQKKHWEGETLFVPEDNFPCYDCKIIQEGPWTRARVLVARFKPGTFRLTPSFAYEWDTPGPELRGTGIVHTRNELSAGYIDYYFVVHVTDTCAEWNRFAGLLLPEGQEERLEGLYEIIELQDLGGLFHITLPENRGAFEPCQKLQLPWPWSFPEPYNPRVPPHFWQEDRPIKQLIRDGAYDAAVEAIKPILKNRPESVQFSCLMLEVYFRKGNEEKANSIIDTLRATYPGDYALYARLNRCFEQLGGWEACYDNWKRIVKQGDSCAAGYIVNKGELFAKMHQSQQAYAEAMRFYEDVLWAVPESPYAAEQYDWILGRVGKAEERLPFWESVHQAFPEAVIPALYLGKSLEHHARFEEAGTLYKQVLAHHPDRIEIQLHQGFILAVSDDFETGNTMIERSLEQSPELKMEFVQRLIDLGSRYLEMDKPEIAEKVYRILMRWEPESNEHHIYCAEAMAAQGKNEDAGLLLQTVLEAYPESPLAAYKLEENLKRQEASEMLVTTWKSLHDRHPDAFIPAYYYGKALELTGRFTQAMDCFHALYKKYPEKPELLLRQGAYVAITQGYEQGRLLMDRALTMNPNLRSDYMKVMEGVANKYEEYGDEKVAERVYKELILANPENGWVRMRYADLLIKHKAYAKAEEVLIDILEWAPESPYASQKLDVLLQKAGDAEKRLSTWKSLWNMHPDTYVPGLFYGQALEDTQSCQSAIQQYKNLQEMYPHRQEVQLRLGALLARCRDYKAGRSLMDSALSEDDRLQALYIELLSELAAYFRSDGNYIIATGLYRELVQRKPDNILYSRSLIAVLDIQGKNDEALEYCRGVLRRDCEASFAADRIDAIYEKRQDASGLVREWREICQACPESIEPWLRLGMSLEANGEPEEAYGIYRNLLERVPENASAKLRYGIVVALLDGYDKGRALMDAAMVDSPELSEVMAVGLVQIAEKAKKRGNHQLAESLYREAMIYMPENYGFYMRLGKLLMEQERLEEALTSFTQVLKACPESPITASLVDKIYIGQRDNKMRLNFWQELLAEHPDAVVPLYYLGLAQESCGEKGAALKSYRVVVERKPDYKEARKSLEQLQAGMN